MRRTIYLFLALLIALWGLSIMRAGLPAPLVAIRDGVFVVLAAAVLFALVSDPLRSIWVGQAIKKSLPTVSAILLVLATAAGIGASIWLWTLLRATPADPALLWALLTWLGAVLVTLIAAFLPSPQKVSTQQTVWSVNAAEQYLRNTPRDFDEAERPTVNRLLVWIGLLAITAVGVWLRMWNFAGLPAGCTENCTSALQALTFLREDNLLSLLQSDAPLFTTLLAFVFGVLPPGMSTLTGVGVVLGTLTIPLFFAAGRAVARTPVALIGAVVLAFAPWHIAMSRVPQPATLFIVFTLAALWASLWATETQQPQRWALAGLLAGLSALSSAGWLVAGVIVWWWLAMPPAGWRDRVVFWGGLLIGGSPALALWLVNTPAFALSGLSLVQSVAQIAVFIQETSPLLAFTTLLALLGLAHLLRRPRWAATRLLVTGIALTVALLFVQQTVGLPGDLLDLMRLLLMLTALVALDQLLGRLIEQWSTAVSHTTLTSLATATTALLLIVGIANGLPQTDASTATAPQDIGSAAGIYLRDVFERSVDNGGSETTLVFVPLEILQAPTTQLAAGGVLPFAKRILPLDVTTHLPLATAPFVDFPLDGDVTYLVPAADRALLSYIGQIYPNYMGETLVDPATDEIAAYVVTVPRAQIEAQRGLTLAYYALAEDELLDELPLAPTTTAVAGPLEFDWNVAPPPPFALTAKGMLYVPEAGEYSFSAVFDEGAQVRMQLGSNTEWTPNDDDAETFTLHQGYLPVVIEYRTDAEDPALSIRWQRPGGKVEPIPLQALMQQPVTTQGMLATYYAADARLETVDDAAILTARHEPLLRINPLASTAGVIVWQAKLAAPVDGSYLFSVNAHGRFDLSINDVVLADRATEAQVSSALQLRRGWHDLVIRYEPTAEDPAFTLRWQPAGYQETELPAALLAPYPTEVDTTAWAIPDVALEVSAAPPPAAFELPQVLQTEENPLPTGLPELPMQMVWAAGSCSEDGFQPRGVVVWPEQNLVLAADLGNARVVAYDLASGEIVTTYTDATWLEPFDLGRNLLGEVFLLDAVAQQIYRFDGESDGFVALPQETSFYRPRGLGVSADGSLVVADTGGARVVVLTAEGEVRTQYGGPDTALGQGQPVDALLQPNGALWVITAEDGQLWRLDQGSGQASTARANTFTGPHLASLPNNSVLVSDPERHLLTLYTAAGQATAQFQEGGFMTPVGIDAAGVNDQLLIAVSDSGACQVTLWQMAVTDLP